MTDARMTHRQDGTFGATMHPVAASKAEVAKAAREVAAAADRGARSLKGAPWLALALIGESFEKFAEAIERGADD